MPVFTLQAPDGRKVKIEAADQATAMRGAQEWYASTQPTKASAAKGLGKALVTGAVKGVVGLAQQADATTPTGIARNVLSQFGGPSSPGEQANSFVARHGYKPQTRAERYTEAVAEMIPNALAPGGPVRRGAAVLLPGLAGEGLRETAEGMGAGQTGQAVAKFAGNLLGGGVAAARVTRGPPRTPVNPLPRQNPNELARRAAEYRAAGIEPALVDIVDDSARGTVRAAASRQTPARQRATDFQDTRAIDLPSRMGGQARRVVSQDPRTPDQIRTEMAERRATRADASFGAVRGDQVQLAPEGVQALRTDYGRAAIREAARRERDPEVRAALNRLAEDALDNPSTPITVGMADRISRVLLGQAQEAGRRGDNDLASTLGGLGRAVRSPTAQASPGYRQALDDYGADTRLQEAAGVGENLLKANTDEFAQQAGRLTPEERTLAQAAARRAIERRAGENTGAAPGVARQIANAPEQQARNRALLGDQRATQLQDAMRLEERRVRNANDIAPRFGSQTQNKAQDALETAARTGVNVARGNWVGIGMDWLRSRGMNDQQAEALVNMALDPAQTNQAIALIAQRFGPQARQQFSSWRNAALLGASAGAAAMRPEAPE